MNTFIHHGIKTTCGNGFTEEVTFKSISVEVTGRVIHRNACLIPDEVNGLDGFEYVVPLLVKE